MQVENQDMKKHLKNVHQRLNNIPLVIRYGLVLAVALICLKTLEYQVFSFRLNQHLYVGIVACFFLLFGVAVAYFWLRINRKPTADKQSVPILTVKELTLLRGLAKGLTNQQLADSAFLSVNTVKTHLKSVYRKLLVKNRSEAVAKAKDFNLLDL